VAQAAALAKIPVQTAAIQFLVLLLLMAVVAVLQDQETNQVDRAVLEVAQEVAGVHQDQAAQVPKDQAEAELATVIQADQIQTIRHIQDPQAAALEVQDL